jgi:hypothetical protein
VENKNSVNTGTQLRDVLGRNSEDSDALSYNTDSQDKGPVLFSSSDSSAQQPFGAPADKNGFNRFIKRYVIILIILLFLGGGGILLAALLGKDSPQDASGTTGRFADTTLPLTNVPGQEAALLSGQSLAINGPVKVNAAFVLTPQAQPPQAVAGQLYYDQTANNLRYYNGTEFIALQGGGGGDTINNNNITNNISNTTVGGGGVTSSGGTTGRIAKFTGNQSIGDSLLNESGTTITVGGNLGIENQLGIGTTTPTRPFHLLTNNTITDAPSILIEQDGTGDSSLEFKTANNKSFFLGMDTSAGSSFNIASSTSAAATFNVGQSNESCCNSTTFGTNLLWATRVVVGGTGGTLSSISLYIPTVDPTFPGAQVAVYADSGGEPGTLVTSSNEQDLAVGWNIFPMTGDISASTTYWLAFSTEGNSIRNFGSGDYLKAYNSPYNSWPALTGATPAFDSPGFTTPMFMTIVPTGAVDSFNGINVLSISEAGTATFRNSTNSGSAFRVLNAASLPLFVIDTANSRAYIGNPTADTTGALLVLDNKSDAGDPTGTPGGMYYNAARGKMRCFEMENDATGSWHDCVEGARAAYKYTNEMLTRTSDNVTEIFGTTSQQSGATGHPGIVRFMADTVGSDAGAQGGGNAGDAASNILLGNGDIWRYETMARLDDLSTSGERFTFRSGFNDDMTNAEDGTDGCYFRYSDDINGGEWQGVCRDNSSESVCDTGIAVAADTWYRLTVVVNANNSASFQTDGTSRCSVGTDIPSGVGRQTSFMSAIKKEVGTTARNVDVDYIWITSELGSSR